MVKRNMKMNTSHINRFVNDYHRSKLFKIQGINQFKISKAASRYSEIVSKIKNIKMLKDYQILPRSIDNDPWHKITFLKDYQMATH